MLHIFNKLHSDTLCPVMSQQHLQIISTCFSTSSDYCLHQSIYVHRMPWRSQYSRWDFCRNTVGSIESDKVLTVLTWQRLWFRLDWGSEQRKVTSPREAGNDVTSQACVCCVDTISISKINKTTIWKMSCVLSFTAYIHFQSYNHPFSETLSR